MKIHAVSDARYAKLLTLILAAGLANLLAMPGAAYGEPAEDPEASVTSPPEAAQNGLETARGFQTPGSVPDRVAQDAQEKDYLFELPGLTPMLRSWSEWKNELAEKYGLKFTASYTAMYLHSSNSALGTEDNAFGFDFDFGGTWDFLGRGTDSTSTLGFDFFWRDRLSTDLTPLLLFTQYGALNSGAPAYGENQLLVGEIWYQQKLGKFGFRVGQVFPVTAYDFFPFKNFRTDFIDFNHVTNAAIPLPLQGLGGFMVYKPTERLMFRAGVHDANADPTRTGFETFDSEVFKIFEIGYDTGSNPEAPGPPQDSHVHLSIWHQDERTDAGIDEGWGMSATATHRLGVFTPFLRYGWADGGADGPVSVRHMANVGVAMDQVFGQSADRLAIGYTWGKPSDVSLGNEHIIDGFYRVQLTPEIQIGPTVQVIFDPALNPEEDSVIVGGIRTRISF